VVVRQRLAPVAGSATASGHGTAVASLIAANPDDGFGMAGFGGATHLISFRVDYLTDPAVAVALTKLVSLGVRIINLSIGGSTPDTPILVDAVHKAAAAGVLLVAASGNSGGFVSYPAADLQPAGGGRSLRARGGRLQPHRRAGGLLQFGAASLARRAGRPLRRLLRRARRDSPGDGAVDQPATRPGPARAVPATPTLPGTSFSAPEVSGVAALIWAARPELKNYQVAEIIKQSAARDTTAGWTATIGCGRLDAAAALELATRHTSAGPACTSAGDGPPAWPAPVIAPTVTALAASGSRGATVSLPFRVGKASGEVRALIGVQNNGTPIAQLTRGFFPAQTGQVYQLAWRAPKIQTNGTLRFCVVLLGPVGNNSARSCAPIRLR
jgi:subtilisin family serine protease